MNVEIRRCLMNFASISSSEQIFIKYEVPYLFASDSFCLLKNTFPWAFVALHLYVFELGINTRCYTLAIGIETDCSLSKLFLKHHSSIRLVTVVTVVMMSVHSQFDEN